MNTTTTRKQRVVSILLALVLVLSMLSASVFAEENTNQAAVTAGGTTTEFATYAQAVAYANARTAAARSGCWRISKCRTMRLQRICRLSQAMSRWT